MSDNGWYNEWQRVVEQVTSSHIEWQIVTKSDKMFFLIREQPTTKHPRENSLNLKEDLEDTLLKY